MSACVAVLTAAGSGTRLGCQGPKALVELAGQSLVRRAAAGLFACMQVDAVVVTAPADYLEVFKAELADFDNLVVVAGSDVSRQASVANGLAAAVELAPQADVVLIHDAARCLTPPAAIARVIDAVRAGNPAVIPALPVTDTIKAVGPARPQAEIVSAPAAGCTPAPANAPLSSPTQVEPVRETVDRRRLRAVQTPQGFERETILRSHQLGAQAAASESSAASDDAGLAEQAGYPVVVVPGDSLSFKITTPIDLALAQVCVNQGLADL